MAVEPHTDVLVIGAGVIGLTTAITLAEAGHHVLVQAAEPPHETTSAVAGALWGPWMAEPAHHAYRWAAQTLDVLTELAHRPGTGVRQANGIDVSTTDHEPPDWFTLLPDRRRCAPDEIPAGYRYGRRYTAPLVDMPTHLTYLTQRLHAAAGRIEIERINSLTDAIRIAPRVINCSGLGARELVGDQGIFPIRGQHVVVGNPGLTEFLEVDTGDSPDLLAIYPHGDRLVLGGTAQPHNWSRLPDPATTHNILQRCAQVEPRLRNAEVLDALVGLRPTRAQIRLDAEPGPAGGVIVHNYGHGGAGVSLSWGCAQAAAELIEAAQ